MSRIYAEIPQPEEVSTREREDAMGAYLMMFGALAAGLPLPIINLIAAVVYYYVNRNKGRFVKFHTLQSLYSQFPTTILNAVLIFWTIRNLTLIWNPETWESDSHFAENSLFWGYVCVVITANLLYFIFSILGAVRARKGRMYYFLFFGKLAHHLAFSGPNRAVTSHVNAPPK
jgi:uncharacterized Tic20 family protein